MVSTLRGDLRFFADSILATKYGRRTARSGFPVHRGQHFECILAAFGRRSRWVFVKLTWPDTGFLEAGSKCTVFASHSITPQWRHNRQKRKNFGHLASLS